MTHTTQLTHHIQRCFGAWIQMNTLNVVSNYRPKYIYIYIFFCLSDFLMSRSKKEKQEIPSNWSLVVVDVGLLVKVLSLYVDIEYT